MKLLSIIALSGNRDAAVCAAADEVRAATLFAVRDGNTRNLTDTADALRAAGAVTKAGEVAKSRKGAILACLLSAMNSASSARNAFAVQFAGHKGKPSAEMTIAAQRTADVIADNFEVMARAAVEPKVKVKKADPANVPTTGEGNVPTTGEGNVPTTGEGTAEVQSLLSHAKRVIAIYRNRLAKRDAHIAMLEAELSALRATASPAVTSRKRKAA